MFDHWQKADAKVIDCRHEGDDVRGTNEFLVEVQPAGAEPFRARVAAEVPIWKMGDLLDFKEPDVGDVVGVEYDPKNHKVRFDFNDPRLSRSTSEAASDARFDAELRGDQAPNE